MLRAAASSPFTFVLAALSEARSEVGLAGVTFRDSGEMIITLNSRECGNEMAKWPLGAGFFFLGAREWKLLNLGKIIWFGVAVRCFWVNQSEKYYFYH